MILGQVERWGRIHQEMPDRRAEAKAALTGLAKIAPQIELIDTGYLGHEFRKRFVPEIANKIPDPEPEVLEAFHSLRQTGYHFEPITYLSDGRHSFAFALLDPRMRPAEGVLEHFRDPLGPILERGRKSGAIVLTPETESLPEGSRFGVSPEEIEGFVIPEFKKTVPGLIEISEKTGAEVRTPSDDEFNFAADLNYPDLRGRGAATWEWLSDVTPGWVIDGVQVRGRRFNGYSDGGNIGELGRISDTHDLRYAFRLQIVFPYRRLV